MKLEPGVGVALVLAAAALGGCEVRPGATGLPAAAGSAATPAVSARALQKVTLMLDWVANTNHTGLFVARERGYFAQNGLDVNIVEPGEVLAQQAVASGVAQFGVDFQEQHTMARARGLPIVSVAAVLQHNTSGFASPAALGVQTPADWKGLRYGSFGSPFEEPTLRVLTECAGADGAGLKIVDIGLADPLALMATGQIDVGWIFYGWQGIQAQLQGVNLDVLMMSDYRDCVPDYYTPILITSQALIETRPDLVASFVAAVSRGYADAIADPAAAAEVLLTAVPELAPELVRASQAWISPRYRAEASRWGQQSRAVWSDYADWMVANEIIAAPIDVDAAFTNQFLP